MATRGVIARETKNGFKGRYHHWDSYPSGLGKTLWNLYHGYFKRNLRRMLKVLIDEHPAGWSTIVDKDFSLQPKFIEGEIQSKRPRCRCHGDRHEKDLEITEENASRYGCEWAYVFNEEKKTMKIMKSFNEDGTEMIGAFGTGNPNAKWITVYIVHLDKEEPNWKEIEESL